MYIYINVNTVNKSGDGNLEERRFVLDNLDSGLARAGKIGYFTGS